MGQATWPDLQLFRSRTASAFHLVWSVLGTLYNLHLRQEIYGFRHQATYEPLRAVGTYMNPTWHNRPNKITSDYIPQSHPATAGHLHKVFLSLLKQMYPSGMTTFFINEREIASANTSVAQLLPLKEINFRFRAPCPFLTSSATEFGWHNFSNLLSATARPSSGQSGARASAGKAGSKGGQARQGGRQQGRGDVTGDFTVCSLLCHQA